MPKSENVMIGLPDQSTVGAILDAPLGTEVPTSTSAELDSAFVASGYVTSDGLSLATDISTNNITDWSGATVRKVLEEFDGTISWSEMEMSYKAMCHAFGADNVEKTEATADHGTQLHIKLGAHLPEPRAWVFNMKDGDKRMRIVVPNGQVTSVDEMVFNATDPIAIPIQLSCYPDETGECIHIYTDDGQKVAA